MKLKNILKVFIPSFMLEARRRYLGYENLAFDSDNRLDIKREIQEKYGYSGDLLDFFIENKENIIHKWHHYIPLYDRYFSPFRGKKIKFLEIGVSKGGSLQLWRKYFGENAIIFGIDINPECAKYNGLAGQVRIGSQADKDFLEAVVKEMGGIDVVLDDGSHQMLHITKSLSYLFPYLNDGGIYMIEDLHTAFYESFGGGYRSKKSFFALAMDLVNDMHHWYHRRKRRYPDISNICTGIHIHDSIVVLEKNTVHKPLHSEIA